MKKLKIFDKNLKVSSDIHKKLKILSINMGCRIDFLSDFALDYFLDHHDVGNLNENEEYKTALDEYCRMKLIVIK